ncbi:MAG TPA: dihydroorotate dehydrogenase electron transfer subunit [Phycisphaerae bacterium]|nr:dihydroorotate dehydrogenase electron transfer subunit [Phycisphaerae bacterium]
MPMCGGTISKRGVYTAAVRRNERLCDEHFLLVLRLGEFPASAPGQFVQLQCRPPSELIGAAVVEWGGSQLPKFTAPELTGQEVFLRRPFSLAGRREVDGGVELDIIYRTVGTGTSWLAGVRESQLLSLLGPLGNSLPVHPAKSSAALIAGGVGIPPMIYLAAALGEAEKTAVAFSGVRSRNLLPLKAGKEKPTPNARPTFCCAEFDAFGAASVITSDDGSVGYRGLVSEAFCRWLEDSGVARDDLVVYSCGAEPMMRAVGELCVEGGIECYLSLERHMACGMGTCQSCIVKIREDTTGGWSYKLCCSDGPVFEAADVIWE